MTECSVSQEHIAKTYAYRLLTYMESMAEDAMIDLDAAGLSAELSMVSKARDAVQDALAFIEVPLAFVVYNEEVDE